MGMVDAAATAEVERQAAEVEAQRQAIKTIHLAGAIWLKFASEIAKLAEEALANVDKYRVA